MLRWLFFPVSLVFGLVLRIRHFLFDTGIVSSKKFESPIIVVGNLSLGGTGKTPHTEYLVRILKDQKSIATLSRGYGRSTKGFRYVSIEDNPAAVGDEPLQLKNRFPTVTVAVGEDRPAGIDRLLNDNALDVVLLDDAYQHRKLVPGLSILLLKYKENGRERLFPMGDLRDLYSRHQKADLIIISKCPESLSIEMQSAYRERFKNRKETLYFSTMKYGRPYLLLNRDYQPQERKNYVLVSGLADASPFERHIASQAKILKHVRFKDHHTYTVHDLRRIKEIFDSFDAPEKAILTTEKDAVKIKDLDLDEDLRKLPIHVMPIEVELLGNKNEFEDKIRAYVGQDK